MQTRENRDIEYLFKFYEGLTVAKHLQNLWVVTDPEPEGRWLREANVNFWLLSIKWPKDLPLLEVVSEIIKERDERYNPGPQCNAQNYVNKFKYLGRKQRKAPPKFLYSYFSY